MYNTIAFLLSFVGCVFFIKGAKYKSLYKKLKFPRSISSVGYQLQEGEAHICQVFGKLKKQSDSTKEQNSNTIETINKIENSEKLLPTFKNTNQVDTDEDQLFAYEERLEELVISRTTFTNREYLRLVSLKSFVSKNKFAIQDLKDVSSLFLHNT